jgi:hypothetical protein
MKTQQMQLEGFAYLVEKRAEGVETGENAKVAA